jgi:hypothetical protein
MGLRSYQVQAIPIESQPGAVSDSPPHELLTDESIANRIIAGETDLFEVIVRRHNRRLY